MNINRNIFWTELFFDILGKSGVKYFCISPGSRSTPLTFSAASNKKFKCFVHIDERSSGFFALGLAKATGQPVVVITTSGTATAELYPAIIEAYQQRVPLIICTADRPPELIGRGANQTINQKNIYHNHIRYFKDAGLPSPDISGLKRLIDIAGKAVLKSGQGPVHINFPFRKPFEPGSFTDKINKEKFHKIRQLKSKAFSFKKEINKHDEKLLKEILKSLNDAERGLIIAGPSKYDRKEKSDIIKLARDFNFPVIADASSQLRFGNSSNKNIITNYEGFLRNDLFRKYNSPDLILQFGSTPSSKAVESFLEQIKTKRYIINEFGDVFDPWNNASGVLQCSPSQFYKFSKRIGVKKKQTQRKWLNEFLDADRVSDKIKQNLITNSSFPNECRIIPEVISCLPNNTHLMISNSMPIRDFDYFAPLTGKNIVVHTNRGASGIDGIISTALGIKKATAEPTLLLTGDLAFYYDISSLLTAKKYNIPLVIVLINNNGGGIFGMLPISDCGLKFREYFTSPHYLDFASIIRGFKANYKLVKSWDNLKKYIHEAFQRHVFTILEIKTDIKSSVNLRKKYFSETNKIISKRLNEN